MLKTFLFSLLLAAPHCIFAQEIALYNLTCNHKTDPLGIIDRKPRLSWKMKSDRPDVMQRTYQLQVATTPEFEDGSLIWDSEKINSSNSNLVAYAGPPLSEKTRYYWRVKGWTGESESSFSKAAFFETGINDWKAKWIEPVQEEKPDGPAVYLRKDFILKKPVKQARAYVTAHGLYELYLNGEKVGNELFTPGWTAYQERLQYQVYDVTAMLKDGKNAIGAILGDGWYRGYLAWQDSWAHYGKRIGLLAEIEIEYTDGKKERIVTDKRWKSSAEGPIVLNSIYNGETYDARKELTGWSEADFNASSWAKVMEREMEDTVALIATETVPVRRTEEITPVRIFKTPSGLQVVDMGQNMVGWVRLKVNGPAGTTITLRHAEILDKDGEFYNDNLREADATINYTLRGGGEEIYEPRFTFMGFRYVAVEGFPGTLKPENVMGIVVHSDMEKTGTFVTSNPMINQLQSNIEWGQRGNFLDVPTDCPQRDERLGWTGDAQAFVRTAAFNRDVSSFFTKWLKDVAADQDERGSVPFVIPNVLNNTQSSAGWADVVTIAPWTIFQTYGDTTLLREQYPSMKKYVEFVRHEAGDDFIWNGGSVFGDWLFFRPTDGGGHDGYTDHDLIATAFFAYSTSLLQKAAEALGNEADATEYATLLEQVKTAFNDNYVSNSGRITSDSQTSYVLALMFDLLPEEKRGKAVEYLVNNIRARGNHLSTGFLGTPYLCHVLSEHGHTTLAYDLLFQDTFPSWLYPVKMGATTIWERWDGVKPDSTFQDVGMNSFNHYAYGAIGDWMYRVAAGIRQKSPGYKTILIKPEPDQRLDSVHATLESPYGIIVSAWQISDGKLLLQATLPANTSGEIILPEASIDAVMARGKSLKDTYPDAKTQDGDVIVPVGSGKHTFSYTTTIAAKPVEGSD